MNVDLQSISETLTNMVIVLTLPEMLYLTWAKLVHGYWTILNKLWS